MALTTTCSPFANQGNIGLCIAAPKKAQRFYDKNAAARASKQLCKPALQKRTPRIL
jgi:hypothetical protein